jgi:UDP-glucose 4-epimerase
MKALITGCAGFIGSSITDYLLKNGYHVVGIDCFTDYYSRSIKESNISNAVNNEKFTFIERNLLEIEDYPDVDYVFHQAAQAGVRASWGQNFDIYIENNIKATQKLLEYYKDKKIDKFVYASSSSVYGDIDELPMHEKSYLRPYSPYGVTKLAAENLCTLYYKNYSVPTISLRYFTVYGPRQRPDMGIYKFVSSVLNNKEITIYGDGTQTRDFTYIDDVVQANVLASKSDACGEIFNVGGGNTISVTDLIRLIEKNTGEQANVRYIEKQKGDVRDTLADVTKINNMFNWSAKTDIKTGIQRYIEWYKNNA